MSVVASPTGLTAGLAARCCSLRFQELPDDVVELARQAWIDWFAVTLAGSREHAPRLLLDTLSPAGAAGDSNGVSVLGSAIRLAPRDAALVNGTASHALDFDDVNLTAICHATVALGAAALALAEQRDASGELLLAAYVAGYETGCRVALAVGPGPYLRGFHTTGTAGTFGAAAACARLLCLDEEATARALGIAASEAAGLKCSLGTMTKPLHAGKACENGLLAAELAARGFTACSTAIEADQGFAAVCGGGCDMQAALGEPPASWHLRDNLFKYHAACYLTHSTIEGVRALREEHALAPERVRRIALHISELERGACVIAAPRNGLEVKFSIAQLAAMALLGRDTVVIGDEAATDAAALALREVVELLDDGQSGAPTRVEIELDDGSVLETARDVNTPAADLAAQREGIERKFLALAEPVLGAADAARLLDRLVRLEATGARELMAAAAPG